VFYVLILALGLQTPAPVRVRIWTAVEPSALVDQAQKDRQRTVADLTKGLKSKDVEIVSTKEEATLAIEVLERQSREPRDPAVRRAGKFALDDLFVTVRLRVADYATDITGLGGHPVNTAYRATSPDLRCGSDSIIVTSCGRCPRRTVPSRPP
jgi:hypothetical protein